MASGPFAGRSSAQASAHGSAEEEEVADAPRHCLEHTAEGDDLDLDARLLESLADGGLSERLALFDLTTRHLPATTWRSDEQEFVRGVHDDGSGAEDVLGGAFPSLAFPTFAMPTVALLGRIVTHAWWFPCRQSGATSQIPPTLLARHVRLHRVYETE